MNRKCLYCYKELAHSNQRDYHDKCILTFFGSKQAPLLTYSLNEMNELAKNVVESSITVPGVQPKLSLSLIDETLNNNPRSRLTVVGALGGSYILKPPSEFYPEMPQNEHVTMQIAEAFGIPTVPSSLIKLNSGELSYITKRIDRTETGDKIHMLDMFQILEAVDKYKSSMESIGKAIASYSDNTLMDQLSFFETSLFSFLTGNNDMHLKNFSMIQSSAQWILSPAYDLLNVWIVNPADTEELALTLEGQKKKLKREHFERFGARLGLNSKQIEGVFGRYSENKSKAVELINKSFLSNEFQIKYLNLLEARYETLELST